ncbi:TerB family tellurite resistance protein [Hellea sp.]|nr:TerB family tellurite resistance protein [Hellea sp.]
MAVNVVQWTHILTLLSVVIVADNRVYKEEVDAFVERSLTLKEVITPKMLFSKKMAFDWFVLHREGIKDWLDAPDSETTILRHILALAKSEFRQDILDALYAVAIVDGDYHEAESNVIALACEHWHLPMPEAEIGKV